MNTTDMSTTAFSGRLVLRGEDEWGNGAYGASRGGRTHKGIDIAAYPGTLIQAIVPGEVTKLGYVYDHDLSFRYVQISLAGVDYRYFYVRPNVSPGQWVWSGQSIGRVQDIASKYTSKPTPMINHMHFSMKRDGVHLDPTKVVLGPETLVL